jgi:adenosylcobinamide-phosphate synthase
MDQKLLVIIPLILGYLLDLIFADPESLPHPVRFFGFLISTGEKLLNTGKYRFMMGMLLSTVLIAGCFITYKLIGVVLLGINVYLFLAFATFFVFFGLANKGLIKEGRKVFWVLENNGVEAGRKQLSRIVGRDTSRLSEQQIRVAVFETMSENLSDGVIAPLFYYAIAGVEGMMTYKMINTLDSMVGYRNERYEQFGKFAARIDDVANFIPARLTAVLMSMLSFSFRGLKYLFRFGRNHKSPNSGYPEAALAGILNCRFGGPNFYQGKLVEKPFIGETERVIQTDEIGKVIGINHKVCLAMVVIIIGWEVGLSGKEMRISGDLTFKGIFQKINTLQIF